MRSFLLGPALYGSKAADFGLLILRLVGGLTLAFAHGFGKVPPAQGFVETIGRLGFPMPEAAAWGAALVETAVALLVAIGLLTRPASLILTAYFLVIVFWVHGADQFKDKEPAVMFLMWAATLLFTGPGRFSLDWIAAGRGRRTT